MGPSKSIRYSGVPFHIFHWAFECCSLSRDLHYSGIRYSRVPLYMDKNANYTVDRDINMIKCYPVLFVIFCDGLDVQQIAFSRLLKHATREARQKKVCCPQHGNSVFSIGLSWRDQSPSSLLTSLFVSSRTNDETDLRIGPKELSEFTRHPGVVWVSRHPSNVSFSYTRVPVHRLFVSRLCHRQISPPSFIPR